jgi:hypothetical protein
VDKHKLSLVLLFSFCFGITACGSTPKPAPKATESTETPAEEDDDGRGFDPCLINPKLAVCNKNENTDQQ